jgi:hypothetical protein
MREKIMAQTQSRRALPDLTKAKYNTTLAEIVMAIKRRDLTSALRYWEELEDHRKSLHDGDACRLPDATIKDLHKSLCVVCCKLTRKCLDYDEPPQKLSQCTLLCHHFEEALCMLMVHYIKSGHSQTVLQLYNDYRPSLGNR